MHFYTILLVIFFHVATCRDFYVGMFKKNDWLVAQDRLYKDRVPYKYMYAKYGRIFKCKITYFRVSDRLGYGPGPKVQIVRGGLRHNYLVLRLTSPYNMPISVNIYVGCANTFKITKATTPTTVAENNTNTADVTSAPSNGEDGSKTTAVGGGGNGGDNTQTTGGNTAGGETTAAPAE